MEIVSVTPWGGAGLMFLVYCNLFLCKFLKIRIIDFVFCALQEGIYSVYRKIFLKHLIAGGMENGMGKIISTGYFMIARKK